MPNPYASPYARQDLVDLAKQCGLKLTRDKPGKGPKNMVELCDELSKVIGGGGGVPVAPPVPRASRSVVAAAEDQKELAELLAVAAASAPRRMSGASASLEVGGAGKPIFARVPPRAIPSASSDSPACIKDVTYPPVGTTGRFRAIERDASGTFEVLESNSAPGRREIRIECRADDIVRGRPQAHTYQMTLRPHYKLGDSRKRCYTGLWVDTSSAFSNTVRLEY